MKRFQRLLALVMSALLISVVLCACSGEGAPTDYTSDPCNHAFGPWHDAVETAEDGTETPAGQIRYCKICNAEERQ